MRKLWMILILMLFIPVVVGDVTTNLEMHLKLDETSGTAADATGNGHTGTLTGSIGQGEVGIVGDYSYHFAAGTSHLSGTDPAQAGHNDQAMSMWVYNNGTAWSSDDFFFSVGTEAVNQKWEVKTEDSGTSTDLTSDIGGNAISIQLTNNLEVGGWHHLVLSYDSATKTVSAYVDGSLEGTAVHGGSPSIVTNVYYINAGATGGNGNPSVFYDDVRFYQRELTSTDVLELFSVAGFGTLEVQLNDSSNSTAMIGSPEFNATLIPSYNMTLVNATFYLWNSTNYLVNSSMTNLVTGTSSNITSFTLSGLGVGKYKWNVLGCGYNGTLDTVCVFDDANNSFDYGYVVNSETFTTPVGDLSNSSFTLNITKDPSVNFAEASLDYNGTLYTASKVTNGQNIFFTRNIDIPSVDSSTSKNFKWVITLQDTFFENFNTTTKQQNIVPSTLGLCTGSNTELTINYTLFDEGDQSSILGDMDISFNWSLSQNGITKNASFSQTGKGSYSFCVNVNQTFYVDADIELSADGYTSRQFSFRNELLSNNTQVRPLYLLNTTDGRDIIIKLKDLGLRPLEGYEVEIFRKLQSGGLILVENDVTDFLGQAAVRLVENDVHYLIKFYDTEGKLVKLIPDSIVVCTTTICEAQYILTDDTNVFSQFDDLEEHTYSLTFDNTTREFTFVWVDNRGESQTHRLLIEQTTFGNGTVMVYNGTSTASSGVLTYTAPDSKATYRVTAYRLVGGVDRRLVSIHVDVGNLARTFGFEGLYWSFILSMVMLLIGRFSPPVGIVLYLFGAILLGVMDIVFINPSIMIAELVIGVIFIWAWRG